MSHKPGIRNLPLPSITCAFFGIATFPVCAIAVIRSPVMITVILGSAGAPVASITVTSDMARIFSGRFDGGQGKAREIKSKAGAKTVFILKDYPQISQITQKGI